MVNILENMDNVFKKEKKNDHKSHHPEISTVNDFEYVPHKLKRKSGFFFEIKF